MWKASRESHQRTKAPPNGFSPSPSPATGAGQLCPNRAWQAPPPEYRLGKQEASNPKVSTKQVHLAWVVVNNLNSIHSLNHRSTE